MTDPVGATIHSAISTPPFIDSGSGDALPCKGEYSTKKEDRWKQRRPSRFQVNCIIRMRPESSTRTLLPSKPFMIFPQSIYSTLLCRFKRGTP